MSTFSKLYEKVHCYFHCGLSQNIVDDESRFKKRLLSPVMYFQGTENPVYSTVQYNFEFLTDMTRSRFTVLYLSCLLHLYIKCNLSPCKPYGGRNNAVSCWTSNFSIFEIQYISYRRESMDRGRRNDAAYSSILRARRENCLSYTKNCFSCRPLSMSSNCYVTYGTLFTRY